MRVAVLGASPNPERYSNKAMRMLKKYGHEAVPVTPGHKTVEGVAAVASLAEIAGPVDTVTVYVGPAHIGALIDGILAARPRRVIMNPGAESRELGERARGEGVEVVEACTLVLLTTGQF